MEEKDNKEKAKVLNGARELFKKFGVRSITMDDIAHQLGISKKTIYLYFRDKDDIVRQAIQNVLKVERERISAAEREAKDAIHLIYLINQCLRETLRDVNSSLLFDLQKYHAASWKLIEEYRYGFMLKSIARNLQWGVEEELFREDINTSVLSVMRLEQATLAHNEHIFPKHEYSLMEIQSQFFEHFLQGILTDKGRKHLKKCREELVESSNH